MSSSALTTPTFQAKIGSIQNQADSTSVYSNGVWSLKNSTALTSVTITDAGNVGIGTASPAVKLQVEGSIRIPASTGFQLGNGSTYFYTTAASNGDFVFGTSSVDRMRIDASGNLLVGTTSSSDNTDGVKIEQTALRNIKIMKTSTGAVNGLLFYQAGIYQGGLNYGNGSTSLATSSDERLKKNIKTAENVLNKVQQIQVRSFDWKDYDAKVEYGFVAQELHQVFPEAVNVGKDNEEGGIEMSWSVSSSTLIPHLVKAIQELSAKVDAQAAEIAALKAK